MAATENFALPLPQMGEPADIRVLNRGTEEIDGIMNGNRTMFAPAWVNTETYHVGSRVVYLGEYYKCKADNVIGAWDATKWDKLTVGEDIEDSTGGARALADLDDVEITSPSAGQALLFDDSDDVWKNQDLPDVEANPSASATANLSKLKVGSTVYGVSDLPSTSSASNGDVLTLASGKVPTWASPAVGGDGVTIDTSTVITSGNIAEYGALNYTATQDCFVAFLVNPKSGYTTYIKINNVTIKSFYGNFGNSDGLPYEDCVFLKTGQALYVNNNANYPGSYHVYGVQEINSAVVAQLNAMKTGFDGVTYPSPVEMVQGCDTKLDSYIDMTNASISDKFPNDLMIGEWIQGGWSSIDSNPTPSTDATRIRKMITFTASKSIEFSATNQNFDYVYGIYQNGTKIYANASWSNSYLKRSLTSGTYTLYVAIRHHDNSSIIPIEAFSSGIDIIVDGTVDGLSESVMNYFAKDTDEKLTKSQLDKTNEDVVKNIIVKGTWESGSWTNLSTSPTKSDDITRIRNKITFYADKNFTINTDSAYGYIYGLFDSNGTLVHAVTSWSFTKNIEILNSGTYDLYIAVRNSGNSNINPIDIFSSAIIATVDYSVSSFDKKTNVLKNELLIGAQFGNQLDITNLTYNYRITTASPYFVEEKNCIISHPINVEGQTACKIISKNLNPTNKRWIAFSKSPVLDGSAVVSTNGDFGVNTTGDETTYTINIPVFAKWMFVTLKAVGSGDDYIYDIITFGSYDKASDFCGGKSYGFIKNGEYYEIQNDPIVTRNAKALQNMPCVMKKTGEQSDFLRNKCTILHISDSHSDFVRWNNFLTVSAAIKPDAIVHTGDIVRYTGLDDSSYVYDNLPSYPMLVALGNHDVGDNEPLNHGGLTNSQAYTRFIEPLKNKYGISATNNYYYQDINGVRFIILNNYDYDVNDGNNFVSRRVIYSQDQITWLINTLHSAISDDIPVVVCAHECDYIIPNANGTTIFNQYSPESSMTWKAWSGYPICDLIKAFMEGSSINQTYSQSSEGITVPSITVNTSFSSSGKFICWLVGHRHADVFGFIPDYNQLAITVGAAACNINSHNSTNIISDLPRLEGTKTEDLFNGVVIDTENKTIGLIRFGSDKTGTLTDRDVLVVFYEYVE